MTYSNDYETRNNTLNLDLDKTVWRLTVADILAVMQDIDVLEELDDDDVKFVVDKVDTYLNIDNWAEIVSSYIDNAICYRKINIKQLNKNIWGNE